MLQPAGSTVLSQGCGVKEVGLGGLLARALTLELLCSTETAQSWGEDEGAGGGRDSLGVLERADTDLSLPQCEVGVLVFCTKVSPVLVK